MERSLKILLLSFIVLARSTLAQSASQPFTLTISPSEVAVKTGSEVEVEIALQNTSNRAFSISRSVGKVQFDLFIEVYDSSGKPVADTEFGRRLKERGAYSSDVIFTLQPGETVKCEVSISKLYELARPGKYTIQAPRRIPNDLGKGVVRSNKIAVTITE